MKSEREFLYHNVIIKIFKEFGYSYLFTYANIDYYPISNWVDISMAIQEAKTHVDQILAKRNNLGDDLEIGA